MILGTRLGAGEAGRPAVRAAGRPPSVGSDGPFRGLAQAHGVVPDPTLEDRDDVIDRGRVRGGIPANYHQIRELTGLHGTEAMLFPEDAGTVQMRI